MHRSSAAPRRRPNRGGRPSSPRRRGLRRRRAGVGGGGTGLVAALAVALTVAVAVALAVALAAPGPAGAAPRQAPGVLATGAPTPFPGPSWVDTVGPVALSSPVPGVLDGTPVVAFGTESGYLYVVNARTGADMPGWPQPVELAPGEPTAVESSPTFAYLHGPDNPPTIVVGAGSTYVANQQGGLVAFRPNGTVLFRFDTLDVFNEWQPTGRPDGYREGVFSTPAVGDVTGKGQLDLVFGSWDHHLYALTPTGHLVHGFPVDTQDTIWSSPALFHLRGSPSAEDILIGGDASGRDGCHGGFVTDYTYAHGAPRIVWQHCENQTIWSSPAVGVINATGQPAVVVGTGFGEPPPYKSDSYKLFAFYAATGETVPGWPVTTAGPSFGSPAIGTLPGSPTPAVVDTSWCTSCGAGPGKGSSEVYAWSGTGQVLWSRTLGGPNDFSSPILVDLTGSGQNDVLVGSSDGMYPLSGADGSFLFGTSANSAINPCSMLNSAAVEDVPGTGPGTGWHVFEACGGPHQVTGTGTLYDYPLPATPATPPPWPMWRGDENHDGVATASFPEPAPTTPPTTTTPPTPPTTLPTPPPTPPTTTPATTAPAASARRPRARTAASARRWR